MPPEIKNNSPEIDFQLFWKRILNIKKLIIIAIISSSVVLIALIISIALSNSGKNKSYENLFSGEIKEIKKELSDLRQQRKIIEDSAAVILSRIDKLSQDRVKLERQLSYQLQQLSITKKSYEKINTYNNLSGDSLRRILSEKFGN